MSDDNATIRSVLSSVLDEYFGQQQLWSVLKYKTTKQLKFEDYLRAYKRQDIASRIVKIPAVYTWRSVPELNEDDSYTNVIDDIEHRLNLFNKLERIDELSGIGEYGVLFLGIDDGKDLDKPVDEGSLNSPEDIMYITPYKQDHVKISETEKDRTSRRFGKPVMYQITTVDNGKQRDSDSVHWTRVIHIADNKKESDVWGTPRLQEIYNRVVDLDKVAGSTAEAFFRMVTDKILFDLDQNVSLTDSEKEEFNKQAEELIHGFRNVMRTRGVEPKTISTNMESPQEAFDVIINLICAAKGYPRKFILGAERGEITSSMDVFTFFDSMQIRRNKYAEKDMLKRIMNRFAYYGLFEPKLSYNWDWNPLYELSPKEKTEIAKNIAMTIKIIGTSEVLGTITTAEEVREKILGWDEASAGLSEPIVKNIQQNYKQVFDMLQDLSQKAEINKEDIVSNVSKMQNKFQRIARW